MAEIKTCSRCHSKLLLKYFEVNRQGNYFKTCNNCRSNNNTYRQDNKESINEKLKLFYQDNKESILERKKIYYQLNKESINEKITCPVCFSIYRKDRRSTHIKTKKHLNYNNEDEIEKRRLKEEKERLEQEYLKNEKERLEIERLKVLKKQEKKEKYKLERLAKYRGY